MSQQTVASTPQRGLLEAARGARHAAVQRRAGTERLVAARAFSLAMAQPLSPPTPPPPPVPIPTSNPEPAAPDVLGQAATPASAEMARAGSADCLRSGSLVACTPMEGVLERPGPLLPRTTPARLLAGRVWEARTCTCTPLGCITSCNVMPAWQQFSLLGSRPHRTAAHGLVFHKRLQTTLKL